MISYKKVSELRENSKWWGFKELKSMFSYFATDRREARRAAREKKEVDRKTSHEYALNASSSSADEAVKHINCNIIKMVASGEASLPK